MFCCSLSMVWPNALYLLPWAKCRLTSKNTVFQSCMCYFTQCVIPYLCCTCRYNLVMLGLSISFLILSYMLTGWAGGIGFILANCLNMGLRILHSILFIYHYFQASQWRPLHGLLPSPLLILALAVSAVATALSEVWFKTILFFFFSIL